MTPVKPFSDRSPRLSLPYLFPGQTQREFYVNEGLCRLDMLVHPAIEDELVSPPSEPTKGQTFIVAESPSGDWEGFAGQLAHWDGTQWTFAEPLDGMTVYDRAARQMLRYDGGWVRAQAPAPPQGGTVVDSEARAALSTLMDEMRKIGLIA